MNEYRVSFDEEYVTTSVAWFRTQRNIHPWPIALQTLGAISITILLAASVCGTLAVTGKPGLLILVVMVLSIGLLLLQSPRIDLLLLERKLRKSPFYGRRLRIMVSDEGVCVAAASSRTTFTWLAFKRARRVASGYLLFTGPTAFQWWPDKALASGTQAEVAQLLRRNVGVYENLGA